MTNWDDFVDMVENQDRVCLADYLCKKMGIACKFCPASEYCYVGHNGMYDWLLAKKDESNGRINILSEWVRGGMST